MSQWTAELLNARILVIDDEPANVRVLERLLLRQGCTRISTTTDPREGLALYASERPDLVLLDVRMPYMDGFEVLAAVRELSPDDLPPILVLTAHTDMDIRLRALDSGARDFLTKPFDCLEALSRIRNMLDMRMLQKNLRCQNDALQQLVHARTSEVTETRLEVVRRLGRAAEYRDNETGLHIIRMSKISENLARHAGLSAAHCDLILNASPMHDIGKIGIPDSILLKRGKLDPDQWEVMKRHTLIGAEILSGHGSELMTMARSIALSHHEKWDGSGYPFGLAGDDIPLEGRITAVADVFDALTSIRPYKQAWPVEAALDELDQMAGTHLDPDLVAIFQRTLPETLNVLRQHAEPTHTASVEVSRHDHQAANPCSLDRVVED